MHKFKFSSLLIALTLFINCKNGHQGKSEKVSKPAKSNLRILENISLPPGFRIEIFADGLIEPRSLAKGEGGTVFFGNRTKGNVFALKNFDDNLLPDSLYTIATDLEIPNGVAYHNGDLYIAETSTVSVIRQISDKLGSPTELLPIFDDMPGDYMHGWRYMNFGPDDELYVAVGASCDACEESEEYASIYRMNADGAGHEIFASGIRNSVGFDWHPLTGEMWFSDNGSDELGASIPPDEINKIAEEELHFGFPYKQGSDIYNDNYKCPDTQFTDPEFELPAHIAPLGIQFYTGKMFPSKYRNQLFICEHGSRTTKKKRGYRISLLELDANNKVSNYSVFASGWLNEETQKVHGRPVDMEILPDGSLLVSDDFANIIYRISYSSPKTKAETK